MDGELPKAAGFGTFKAILGLNPSAELIAMAMPRRSRVCDNASNTASLKCSIEPGSSSNHASA